MTEKYVKRIFLNLSHLQAYFSAPQFCQFSYKMLFYSSLQWNNILLYICTVILSINLLMNIKV